MTKLVQHDHIKITELMGLKEDHGRIFVEPRISYKQRDVMECDIGIVAERISELPESSIPTGQA